MYVYISMYILYVCIISICTFMYVYFYMHMYIHFYRHMYVCLFLYRYHEKINVKSRLTSSIPKLNH